MRAPRLKLLAAGQREKRRRDLHLPNGPVALEPNPELRTRVGVAQLQSGLPGCAYRFVVDRQKQVTGLQARLGSGRSPVDAHDEQTRLAAWRVVKNDTQPTPQHLAVLDDLVQHGYGALDRNGEPDAVGTAAAAAVEQGVDA